MSNESPVAVAQLNGYKGQMLASPKATAVVSPTQWLDLFANYGRGYHSNDIRSMFLSPSVPGLPRSEGPAPTGVLMAPAVGYELGPGFLLPDGRVFQIGANGNTGLYTPSSNTWVAGPERVHPPAADAAWFLRRGRELWRCGRIRRVPR